MNKIITLSNGFKYLHVNSNSNLVSVGFIVNVGARDENKNENGISHFLEHMLFKGTKNRKNKKLLIELDSLGLSYNAMTTHEYTFFELHGNKNDTIKILNLLVDMFLNSELSNKNINSESGVIMEEYNMGKNDLRDMMFNELLYLIFGDSDLSIPIIGTVENIKMFRKSDLSKFKNKYYTLENTTFIFFGDFNKKIIKNYLEKITKNINIQKGYNKRDNFIAVQDIPRLKIMNIDNVQVQVMFGFTFNGYLQNKHLLEAELISSILTSGSSSLLFTLLRGKLGVAYSISSSTIVFEDNSIFIIRTSVDNKKIDLVIKEILNVLIKLKKGIIDNNSIKIAKKMYKNETELEYMDNPDQLHYYAELAVRESEIINPSTYVNKVYNLTKNQIINGINNIFKNNNLNLIIAGKIKEKQKKNIVDYLDRWYDVK